jgi:hypothetical protein
MTEMQAGRYANRIYRAIEAKQITRRQALQLLEKISHCLSTTQFCKLMDLQTACRYNPWLLDEK